ncbi:MAG: acetyl-CoA carboxylase biotin carboxyl carrier protein [Holophaga sp.]|nr:acetyl-CoA carboxylase biotin carboxyl carrier protein [Holophaga sp.]
MSTTKKTLTTAPARRAPAARAPQEPGLTLGFEQIQALVSQVGREAVDELQLECGGVKLHIRKLTGTPVASPAPVPARAALAPAPALTDTPGEDAQPPEDPGIHPITSPIVGTFYRAPTASGAPFVQPGDFVKPGQTLCIIEAMKLMNEIECDVAGEVVAVLAENGQPVEYGERLFTIRVH